MIKRLSVATIGQIACLNASAQTRTSGESLTLSGNVAVTSIPPRIVRPVGTLTTYKALHDRVHAAGDLTLQNALLKFGTPNSDGSIDLTLVARTLRLSESRIVTNGNHLTIFVENFVMDESSRIESFLEANRSVAVAPGPYVYGADGVDGDDGGSVAVYLLSGFGSTVKFDLVGQSGLRGFDGARGAVGAVGQTGRKAKNGVFGTCKRGPGKGKRGGRGGAGGPSGDGGAGGDGGSLLVTFVNIKKPDQIPVELNAPGGKGGEPGIPGAGGPGGRGGKGGGNAGNCLKEAPELNLGPTGPQGPNGIIGTKGDPGQLTSLSVQELVLP